jgi:hypothetical protein
MTIFTRPRWCIEPLRPLREAVVSSPLTQTLLQLVRSGTFDREERRARLGGDAVVGAEDGECSSHCRIALQRSQSRAGGAAALLQLDQTGARGSSW